MLSLHKHKFLMIFPATAITIAAIVGICKINNTPNSSAATSMSVSDAQKAVKEVALAYYHRGTNIQYESERRLAFIPPEQITPYYGAYHVCSGFTQAVYYEAFGMLIPSNTNNIDTYGKNYGKSNYDDVIYYGSGKLSNFLNKLEIGDLVSKSNGRSGHVQLVYDFVKNSSGTRTDALVLESIGGSATIDNADRRTILGIKSSIRAWRNINVSDGDISVANPSAGAGTITKSKLSDFVSASSSFNYTVYRPIKNIASGKYRDYQNNGKLIDVSADKIKTSKARIKYSNIRITKDSSIHYGNTIKQGHNYKYSIKIENMSNSKYTGLTVKENIPSDLINVTDNGGGTLSNNVLTWSNLSIPAKDYITITYKVKVKTGTDLNHKQIISTGTVGDIPSTTVVNTIGNTLSAQQQTDIINAFNSNKSSYKGLELIDKTYKTVFGDKYTLSLKNLKLGLAYPGSSSVSPTQLKKCNNFTDASGAARGESTALLTSNNKIETGIKVNTKHAFAKAVLNNYFNAMREDYSSTSNTCLDTVTMIQYEHHAPADINDIPKTNRNTRIYPGTLRKGDVLIYSNTPFTSEQLKQSSIKEFFSSSKNIKENGTFAYIYDGEKFVGNNTGHSTLTGKDSSGQSYSFNQDIIMGTFKPNKTGEYNNDLSLLFSKDFYVILRPSLLIDSREAQTVSFKNTSVTKKTTDAKFTNVATSTGNGAITYVSSNTDVATIDKTSGQVTIKATGTTTITATAAETTTYLSGKATYTLTVNKADQTVTFTNKSISKKTTDSDFTNIATTKGNGAITYTSSNTNVATVNQTSGQVTIKGAGTATITATAAATSAYLEGKATYTLTVVKSSQTVSFVESSVNKTINDTSFTNIASTTGDGTISYASSNPSVATVNNSGTVTIVSAGKTIITATASATSKYESSSATYVLTIADSSRQKQTVSFAQSSITKTYGDDAFINLATTTGNGYITYTSNNPNIVSVNETTGQVTIQGIGQARITASASATDTYNGANASYTITINKRTSAKPSEVDTIVYGLTGESLSSITLQTNGLDWSNPSETIKYGKNSYSVSYTTNSDSDHYTTETFTMFVQGNSIVYPVELGDGQTHIIHSGNEPASFIIDADYSLFENGGTVSIDETLLSSDNYTSRSGSTIIEISSSYLDTLPVGAHTLTVNFNNGGIAGATIYNINDPDEEPSEYDPGDSDTDPSDEPIDYDKETDQDEYDRIIPDVIDDQTEPDDSGNDANSPNTGQFTEESEDSAIQNIALALVAITCPSLTFYYFKKNRSKKPLQFNKHD